MDIPVEVVLVVCAVVIGGILLAGGVFIGRRCDAKAWNNGVSPCCNKPWKFFDKDSQGGRGYKCKCKKSFIFVSYAVDKERVTS